MKRTLLLITSAVLCGILVTFLPLYIWHKVNFPDNPETFYGLRDEVLEYNRTYSTLREPTQVTPLYAILAISFAISVLAYGFLKRCL
jgi:hypothetical protein